VNMSTSGLDAAAAQLTKQVVTLLAIRIVPAGEVDAPPTPSINGRR
jgi:hypothetical protein